jgi:hypothetical protein
MATRLIAGSLWFYGTWVAYSIVSVPVDLPPEIGPPFAAVVAMVVGVDPLRLLWQKRDPSLVAR